MDRSTTASEGGPIKTPASARDIALSRDPHDRIAERRVDDVWLEQAWADPSARVVVLAGTRFRVVAGAVDWISPDEAPDGLRVLLGERGGQVYLAVIADPLLADRANGDGAWTGLRGVVAEIDPADAALLVHAIGIAEWHWSTRHCPRCGGPLESRRAGHEQVCTACGRSQFPRTDPAVIMVVVDGEAPHDRCLLGRAPAWPTGRYSTLAGFVEPGESMEQAVRREVLEETGVRVGQVDYFASQPWPLPASLMIGFVAHAESTDVHVDGQEIEDARWFTREQMRAEAEAGTLVLPSGISISRSLVEWWYGEELPGCW